MAKIFISYARKDKDEVYPIVDELERNGFDCWIDKNGIESGEQFENVIYEAIDKCDIFLFMASINSTLSKNCGDEFFYANGDKRIVPILLNGAKENKRVMVKIHDLDCIDIYDSVQKEKLIRNLKKWCDNASSSHVENTRQESAITKEHTHQEYHPYTLKGRIVRVENGSAICNIEFGTLKVGDRIKILSESGNLVTTIYSIQLQSGESVHSVQSGTIASLKIDFLRLGVEGCTIIGAEDKMATKFVGGLKVGTIQLSRGRYQVLQGELKPNFIIDKVGVVKKIINCENNKEITTLRPGWPAFVTFYGQLSTNVEGQILDILVGTKMDNSN